jgi:hypothetical protein
MRPIDVRFRRHIEIAGLAAGQMPSALLWLGLENPRFRYGVKIFHDRLYSTSRCLRHVRF